MHTQDDSESPRAGREAKCQCTRRADRAQAGACAQISHLQEHQGGASSCIKSPVPQAPASAAPPHGPNLAEEGKPIKHGFFFPLLTARRHAAGVEEQLGAPGGGVGGMLLHVMPGAGLQT